MKRNERDWAGQLISWIKEAINEGRTVFSDATNDTGVKLESGKTKFPDILLFTDKISGIVFNGWELKFPDTNVDDKEMLKNALEKAERLRSDSFVTWNGVEAIIWKIEDNNYSLESLSIIKKYHKEASINSRDDLSDPIKYNRNEALLKRRANEILHDLGQLYERGELKQAINITGNIVEAVTSVSHIVIPQIQKTILIEKGRSKAFRIAYNEWKIYEKSTLKILSSSSRRPENIIEEEVLAKFTFYNLIGKILFYLTLSENLTGELDRINIKTHINLQSSLETYFEAAKKIDYQAIFKPYFTDNLSFSDIVNESIYKLIQKFTEFDFKILPAGVIGSILENLVPKSEKQKFGQYFTSETLANLVAFPAIQTVDDTVFDPTSGTGSFLNSFYNIFKYHGKENHSELLNQIWGNDISHFPAILSVINLYKQDVTKTDNFPRVTRDDYFNLNVGDLIEFPDSSDYKKSIKQPIPEFNSIASNFPFVQQEDIPNDILTGLFREKFEEKQQAFLQDNTFKINERSDYFAFCIYNSINFLKNNGCLSVITSNAWLGKEYGVQLKKFLLDNFSIKYIVKSNAEHWFSDSKVSTIYVVLEKGQSEEPTKFVTLNFKLEDALDQENIQNQLSQIENIYSEIDNCDNNRNISWRKDTTFNDLYLKTDNSITVCIVPKEILINSLFSQENWTKYFISAELFEQFDNYTTPIYPDLVDVFRGERTGWNPMFIIPEHSVDECQIEQEFLVPYLKDSSELEAIDFSEHLNHYLFVCDKSIQNLQINYQGAYNWIKSFENQPNKNNTKTISEANTNHRPYWYTLRPKAANIVTSINPYERFFFSFSYNDFIPDQRLVVLNTNNREQLEIIVALLNSIIAFLSIEMRGTARNLGVLDLNANDFKRLRVLSPNTLKEQQINSILEAFEPLKQRPIGTIFEEIKMPDRINFDKTILRCYGIDESILESLYQTLASAVNDRVTMKNK
ncbi:N-6 DNA methylase [Dysgonomonas sp. ZJ279]|uniref:N-6 DNA methylase n=1 Tax=Dysgonomonas sp. ZJ279 TaxID=2709796 RepID=UPI0013EB9802|nr:N-6 DNA methylase [Dysgonomonas sp. ZJ279]